MGDINIKVVNKIATNATPDVPLVCGNSKYTITFDFDAEWATEVNRVARFVYYHGHLSYFKEQAFVGNIVNVPVLSNIDYVLVGVYAGDLSTTTPARVRCKRSILCGGAEEQITDDEKETIQAQIADLAEQMQSFGEDLDEQVASSIEEYLKENPPSGGVDFETDHTLKLENGVLSVNTTGLVEEDNTLPITSQAVHEQFETIVALLKTI